MILVKSILLPDFDTATKTFSGIDLGGFTLRTYYKLPASEKVSIILIIVEKRERFRRRLKNQRIERPFFRAFSILFNFTLTSCPFFANLRSIPLFFRERLEGVPLKDPLEPRL